jgi:hypothetical protein
MTHIDAKPAAAAGIDEALVQQLRQFANQTAHVLGLDARQKGLDPRFVRAILVRLLTCECLDMGDDPEMLAEALNAPLPKAETRDPHALLGDMEVQGNA